MEPNSKRNKPGLADLKIDPELRTYKKKNKSTVWIISGFFVLTAVTVLGMTLGSAPAEVETMIVRKNRSDQGLTILNASGYVEPKQKATIAAKITGQVVEMLVEEGMRVEKGQILARIDDREAKARLDSSKADLNVVLAKINELKVNLKDGERDLSRASNLFFQEIASQENLDKAKVAVDRYEAQLFRLREEIRAAETKVKVAKRDLENCTILAPFAGMVVSKDAQIGEMVSPVSAGGGYTRTGIATIVDMNSLEIEVDVNESYIADVKVGQKVIATLDAYPEWKIPAKVRTLIPTADRQKATVKVRIAFDKLDPRILPDMGVKIAFMTEGTDSQSTAPILVIPRAAVRERDGKSIVFILDSDLLERRAVKTGKVVGSTIEIHAGLKEGEKVVVSGPTDLKEGQRAVVN